MSDRGATTSRCRAIGEEEQQGNGVRTVPTRRVAHRLLTLLPVRNPPQVHNSRKTSLLQNPLPFLRPHPSSTVDNNRSVLVSPQSLDHLIQTSRQFLYPNILRSGEARERVLFLCSDIEQKGTLLLDPIASQPPVPFRHLKLLREKRNLRDATRRRQHQQNKLPPERSAHVSSHSHNTNLSRIPSTFVYDTRLLPSHPQTLP